jgi:hypothetical protein
MGVNAYVWVHELAYAYTSGLLEYADHNQLATSVLQRAQYVVVVALNLVLVFATGVFRPRIRHTSNDNSGG